MQFFNQSWAHPKVQVPWMLGRIHWQKTVKHGLFFRPVKIYIYLFLFVYFFLLSSLCVIFFYNYVLTAEHILFLRGSQQRHVRCLRVLRPRGASRKSETSGSSRWKTRVAKTVSLLILVRSFFTLISDTVKSLSWYIQYLFYIPYFL